MWKVTSRRRSFRLSEKASKNLETYTNKVTKTNDNNSLNDVLEKLFEPQPQQLEQTKKDEGDSFEVPPLLFCPLEYKWALREDIVKEGCSDCLEKTECKAWRKDKALPFTLRESASRKHRQTHTWDWKNPPFDLRQKKKR